MSPRDFTPAEGRAAKWCLVAMVAWAVVLRGLVTELTHSCSVDSHIMSVRNSGWGLAFLECSPRLLSDGLTGMLVFAWAWIGGLLTFAYFAYLIVRLARLAIYEFKES